MTPVQWLAIVLLAAVILTPPQRSTGRHDRRYRPRAARISDGGLAVQAFRVLRAVFSPEAPAASPEPLPGPPPRERT